MYIWNPKLDNDQVIQDYVNKDWSLPTFSPLPFAGGEQASSIQLIFEKFIVHQ